MAPVGNVYLMELPMDTAIWNSHYIVQAYGHIFHWEGVWISTGIAHWVSWQVFKILIQKTDLKPIFFSNTEVIDQPYLSHLNGGALIVLCGR